MAQLPHLVSKLKTLQLRILVPREQLTPQTEARVKRALHRYCDHMVAEARRRLSAMRWVGLRALLVGLAFFAVSLAASTGVQRLVWIPEELRTLASESLIVAGWVLMWQPLDTLVSGWWPQWEEERTFKAISAIPLSVHGIDPRSAA
jgi:protein-S-isoprenylcysteine O-methyltransferase Ste14